MRTVVLGTIGLLMVACDGDADQARRARLLELRLAEQEMKGALDVVEERLLGNQAKLHQWQELARRHRHVSALACQNVAEHVKGMAAHEEREQKKGSAKRRVVVVGSELIGRRGTRH